MIIKFCPNCPGRPYTSNTGMSVCPVCGSSLQTEFVEQEDLFSRQRLAEQSPFNNSQNQDDGFSQPGFDFQDSTDPFSSFNADQNSWLPTTSGSAEGNNPLDYGSANDVFGRPDTQLNPVSGSSVPSVPTAQTTNQSERSSGNERIRGKVYQYSSSGKEDGSYRRLPHQKLVDALVYHQRLEDTLHRFFVKIDRGRDPFNAAVEDSVIVNVHGTIAQGMQLSDNCEVEVEGKYSNGVLMARKIYVINGGYKTQINFQHSVRAIIYGILAGLVLAFILYFGISTGGSIFYNIKRLLITWLICFVVCAGLYLLTFFSRIGILTRQFGRRRFPFIGIAIFSLIPTLLFINAFGLGSKVGGLFSSLLGAFLPFLVVLILLFIIIKVIFRR